MGKLVFAIVHEGDAEAVADGLRRDGHRFTRLTSLGGFLGETNSTFLLAVRDEALDEVLAIFARTTGPRDIELPLVLLDRLQDWRESTVHYGGATVLIVELERIVKI